ELLLTQKVYRHMLERSQRELVFLRDRLRQNESQLQTLARTEASRLAETRKLAESRQLATSLVVRFLLESGNKKERWDNALADVTQQLHHFTEAAKRRSDFAKWRSEVANEAAREAVNVSKGRLRKMWAVERLAGNCLQKIMFEQVERSQATEDGFQRIREVTGLQDVKEILNKFLTMACPMIVIQQSSREFEGKLNKQKQELEALKQGSSCSASGAECVVNAKETYDEVEAREADLARIAEDYESAQQFAQNASLALDSLRKWAARMEKSFAFFD
ncbi:unnamed protein product, partial [Amoebophrya sp. A25]